MTVPYTFATSQVGSSTPLSQLYAIVLPLYNLTNHEIIAVNASRNRTAKGAIRQKVNA